MWQSWARRWAYRRNAEVPRILAKPMSMEPVQPQGSSRPESLGTCAAHPLAVLAHSLACIRRPHHVAIFLRHACANDCHGLDQAVIHAVDTAKLPSDSTCGSSSGIGTPHGAEINPQLSKPLRCTFRLQHHACVRAGSRSHASCKLGPGQAHRS